MRNRAVFPEFTTVGLLEDGALALG